MDSYTVNDLRQILSNLINGALPKDYKYYRKIWSASGIEKTVEVLYSISYSKTYRDDDRNQLNLARGLKFMVNALTGAPLYIPAMEKSSDTFCKLVAEVVSFQNYSVKLKYDFIVLNGSFLHKRIVKIQESNGFFSHINNELISISESEITIKRLPLDSSIAAINIKGLLFGDDSFTLFYD